MSRDLVEGEVPNEALFMGGLARGIDRGIDRGIVRMNTFFLEGGLKLRLSWRVATGRKMTRVHHQQLKEAMDSFRVPDPVHKETHHVRPDRIPAMYPDQVPSRETEEATFLRRVGPLLTADQRQRIDREVNEIRTSSSSDSSVSSSSSSVGSSSSASSEVSEDVSEEERVEDSPIGITKDDILGTIEDMGSKELLSYGLFRVSEIMGADEDFPELEVD